MSISNELRQRMRTASEKEWEDNHLSQVERRVLCGMIREQDNIDESVTDEQIYDDYIIN